MCLGIGCTNLGWKIFHDSCSGMGAYLLGIVLDFVFFASVHLMRALIVYNIYTHTHGYRHTQNTHMHAYIHITRHIHTCVHTYIHTTKHTHACIHTHTHACTHTTTQCMHTHTCIHAHIHTQYILTDMHTYIPTALPSIQTQSKPPPGPWTYLFLPKKNEFPFF